jgi:hypothetical protein
MADSKISALPHQTTEVGTDYLVTVDDPGGSPDTRYITATELITSMAATAAETTTGTEAAKIVTPDGLAGSGYGKRTIEVDLCGVGTLTTSDAKYFVIPSWMNGWNLINVMGHCATNTTGPTITVKNGTTSMLTTNITFDNTQLTTATASVPAVIDTAHDDVATDAWIEVKCSSAGSGITYCVIALTFQLP